MIEITLNAPVVDGNRVRFSWTPSTGLFKTDSFTVAYPDLSRVEASQSKLAEAYFPLCLAFACLDNVHVKLPARIDEAVFRNWKNVFRVTAAKLALRPNAVIENGDGVADYKEGPREKTVLFFGGGSESLLTLARLVEKGVRPVLASFGGPNWPGSNPQDNPDKFLMDRTVSDELGLELLRVRTNFKDIFDIEAWRPRLKPGVSLINALVSLPSFLSYIFPVAEQLGVARLVNGNEKMNFPEEYYCFSPAMTDRLAHVAKDVEYESHLGELLKEDVCYELYRHYRPFAKFQYSCWRNHGQRWCYACQSCLEYYMLLKNNDLDPSIVGMDETAVRMRLGQMVRETARSGEGRPGEIWERIVTYPRLRQDRFLRRILDEVRVRAFLYHGMFRAAVECVPVKWRERGHVLSVGFRRRLAPLEKLVRFAVRRARLVLDAWRFDAWIVTGVERSGGETLRIAYAGLERHMHYFADLACSRSSIASAGKVWAWDVERALLSHGKECDLLVCEAEGPRLARLAGFRGLRVPVWMMTEFDVSGDAAAIAESPSFQNVRRRIRQNGFEAETTRDEDVFDEFYSELYVPHVRKTHGASAFVETYANLKDQFRDGELLVIRMHGRIAGGLLIHYESPELGRLSSLGVRESREDYVKMGITDALIYFAALRIKEKGCVTASLGFSRSFLKDGPLRYKARMGARIGRTHHASSGYLALKPLRWTAALRKFFLSNPFISIGEDGYRGVMFAETNGFKTFEDVKPLLKDRFCRGLDRLDVYVFDGAPAELLDFPESEPRYVRVFPADKVLKRRVHALRN